MRLIFYFTLYEASLPTNSRHMLSYPGLLLLVLGIGGLAWFGRDAGVQWSLHLKDTYLVATARGVTGILAVLHLVYAVSYFAVLHGAVDPVWGQLQFNLSFLGYWYLKRIAPEGTDQTREWLDIFARVPRRLPPPLAALVCFGAGHLVFVAQMMAAFL